MRKKLIIALISTSLILSLTGCSNEEKKESNVTGKSEVTENESEKETISSEEALSIYNSKIDKVKKFFEKHNIPFKQEEDKYGNLIINVSTNLNGHNLIASCSYRLFYSKDGIPASIDASVLLGIDNEKVNSEGFKIEDSVIKEFRDIFVDKELDIDAVNRSIKDYYKDELSDDAYIDSELGENSRESIEYDHIYMNYAWSRDI